MLRRRVVVAIPARDEEGEIISCLEHLSRLERDARVEHVTALVLANNCRDDTAAQCSNFRETSAFSVAVRSVDIDAAHAHAGWARRLSFQAAADLLAKSDDVLTCTDADTWVTGDWLMRTLDHLDAGYDAVAGIARLKPVELRKLEPDHRRRLAAIRRYEDALITLDNLGPGDEPSPRHPYELGASIALTLGAFRTLQRIPAPAVGEDRALFDALRAQGLQIRHPKDVRVLTSCRLTGRASNGTAEILAHWGQCGEAEPLGLKRLLPQKGSGGQDAPLTWATLGPETQKARALISSVRSKRRQTKNC